MSQSMAQDPAATVIDMTPEGRFVPPRPLFGLRATGLAVAATAIGSLLVSLVLVVWLAFTVLPLLMAVALGVYLLRRLGLSRRRHRFQHSVQRWS